MIFTQVQHPHSLTSSLLVFSSHDAAEDAYQLLVAAAVPVVDPYSRFQAFATVSYGQYYNAIEFLN